MSFLAFFIFSLIEIIAVLCICCALFRFKVSKYLVKFIIFESFIVVGNFLIRHETTLDNLSQLFSLLMLILFLKIFLEEVSLLWAAIIGVVGYLISAVIQGLFILLLFNTTTMTTMDEMLSSTFYSSLVQFGFSVLAIIPAQYLYRKGIGFTFNVDRFKLAGENVVILIILCLCLIFVGIVFFTGDLILITILLFSPIIFLIYYAMRKQREAANGTSFLE